MSNSLEPVKINAIMYKLGEVIVRISLTFLHSFNISNQEVS